jgi:hypothetical protein
MTGGEKVVPPKWDTLQPVVLLDLPAPSIIGATEKWWSGEVMAGDM